MITFDIYSLREKKCDGHGQRLVGESLASHDATTLKSLKRKSIMIDRTLMRCVNCFSLSSIMAALEWDADLYLPPSVVHQAYQAGPGVQNSKCSQPSSNDRPDPLCHQKYRCNQVSRSTRGRIGTKNAGRRRFAVVCRCRSIRRARAQKQPSYLP